MQGKYTFREPLFVDEDGLYITAAQMQFFLNRRGGAKKLSGGDPEFFHYYNNCRMYNLIYDLMDKDATCAKMCWDADTEVVSVVFPLKGKIATILASISSLPFEEGDEDEDIFGLFS